MKLKLLGISALALMLTSTDGFSTPATQRAHNIKIMEQRIAHFYKVGNIDEAKRLEKVLEQLKNIEIKKPKPETVLRLEKEIESLKADLAAVQGENEELLKIIEQKELIIKGLRGDFNTPIDPEASRVGKDDDKSLSSVEEGYVMPDEDDVLFSPGQPMPKAYPEGQSEMTEEEMIDEGPSLKADEEMHHDLENGDTAFYADVEETLPGEEGKLKKDTDDIKG